MKWFNQKKWAQTNNNGRKLETFKKNGRKPLTPNELLRIT